jgi:predicted metal-dependent hydrolase
MGYAMSNPTYNPLYLQGLEYFNECDFFEAHEVWEELWADCRDDSRKFYQGLIQVAVALHHFGNGNVRGAKKLYHSSRKYLAPYAPLHYGLDLDTFLAQFDACFAELLASEEERPKIEVVPDLIPEVHLDPPPAPSNLH